MNDDRSLERAARSWLEAGPTKAPDRAVDAALLRIETTPQERDLRIPWRLPNMSPIARFAAVAVIGVLAVGGAIYLLRPTAPTVGTEPSPISSVSPTSSPAPSAAAQAIAEGTYVGPTLLVADIVGSINADTKLSDAQRRDLIDNILAIRGGRTLIISIDLHGGRWTLRGSLDGATGIGSEATYTFLDDHTVVLQEKTIGFSGFTVTARADGFSLQHVDAPANESDSIVVKILFESGPFTLVR